jgi:hypothetical protein
MRFSINSFKKTGAGPVGQDSKQPLMPVDTPVAAMM